MAPHITIWGTMEPVPAIILSTHAVKHPQNPKHAWSGNKNIINSNSAMHETVKEKSKTPDQTKSFPLS